jgi:hypothetical protein
MTEETRNLIAFMGTLTAIVLLSRIGGSGADLAIMTGLIGVLGMLARPVRPQPNSKDAANGDQKP